MSTIREPEETNLPRPAPGGSAVLASGGRVKIDANKPEFGWVMCPDCKEDRYVSIPVGQRWLSSTGRCPTCAARHKRKYSGVKRRVLETPYDGRKIVEINWDDRDPAEHTGKAVTGAFACWYCGLKHYALSLTIENPKWDELTIKCRRRRRCRDEERLPNGAKLRRDPDKPNYYGWVTCPVGGLGCKGTRYIHIGASVKGVCIPCSKRQHTQDVTVYDWPATSGGPPGPPIAKILYSQENSRQRQVPVKYLLCQHTQILKGVGARLALHIDERKRFPKHCRLCRLNPDAFLAAVEAARASTAMPSGDGRNKKLETERSEFESAVRTLKTSVLPHKITRSIIAAEYDARRGTLEPLDPSTITKIVQRCYPKGTTVADAVAAVP